MLKILAIGNSFSEDAMAHLYYIAKDYGFKEIVLGNLFIGGCSLEMHWDNASNNNESYIYFKNVKGKWTARFDKDMRYGIQDEKWDIITLQQASGLSGIESSYDGYLTKLAEYIKNTTNKPGVKLAWHMTWAYQSDSSHEDFPAYNMDQMTMYNSIITAVRHKISDNKDFDIIIPSGTAIQNVRTSSLGDTLTRDGFHLSLNIGRYIAGLTWFAAITGCPIDSISYVPDKKEIPGKYLPFIKEAVNAAISRPFSITKSNS